MYVFTRLAHLNEVVDACPGNVKFFAESDEAPHDCDALLIERAPSDDPITEFVVPNKHRLGAEAVVAVMMMASELEASRTGSPEQFYAQQVQKMRDSTIKPYEQLTLEPYLRNVAFLIGKTQPSK